MTQRKRSLAIVATPFVIAGVFACGEEGQTIGENQCPVLPLYHWQFKDAGRVWERFDPNGNPVPTLPPEAFKDLTGNGRCQTPPGYQVSVETGGSAGTGGSATGGSAGTGGRAGTGGARNTGGTKITDGGKG